MSRVTIESTIDRRYLRNRTKDDVIEHVMRLLNENDTLILMLVDLYDTAWRKGWEPGESTNEVCERAHNLLCNLGFDPYSGDGPANIKKLRAALEVR